MARLKLTHEQRDIRLNLARKMREDGATAKEIHGKLHSEGLAPKVFSASFVHSILNQKTKKKVLKKTTNGKEAKSNPWSMQDVRAHLLEHMEKNDLASITFDSTGHVLGEPARRVKVLMHATD